MLQYTLSRNEKLIQQMININDNQIIHDSVESWLTSNFVLFENKNDHSIICFTFPFILCTEVDYHYQHYCYKLDSRADKEWD